MQLQVINSPFNEEQVELLNRLLPTLADAQQVWLSGYITALHGTAFRLASQEASMQAASSVAVASAVAVAPTPTSAAISTLTPGSVATLTREVTILFGSQTGNAQRLAQSFSKQLLGRELKVTLSSMSDFKPKDLKKVEDLLIVVSTTGEGVPPDNALPFYEFLHGRKAPKLEGLRFAVLALGDTSYEFFCKPGKDFDQRLEELGGERICERVDCDGDYDESAAEWFANVLSSIGGGEQQATPAAAASGAVLTISSDGQLTEEIGYSRVNPFEAEVLENLNLNGRGSDLETHHLELSLEGSGLQFEPGDSLGIFPKNHPVLVDALIDEMGWNSDELVSVDKKGTQKPLREALRSNFEITVLTRPLLEQAAAFSSGSGLRELLAPGHEEKLKEYVKGRDLLDLIRDHSPWKVSAALFVSILRKMPARLYSIASSQQANPGEVHLTMRTVRYEAHGRERYGVCSVQCAERLQPGDTLPVYVQHNPNFKLPSDSDAPIIMIGPGTGVAPFRSFLEEREEIGAEGKSWLFFGDRHFLTDFLYQTDWQRWLKEGILTKLDIAFSRDTAEKIYVQHRMLEKSRELFEWLEEGAYVYVCGDESKMARDVHDTLISIIKQEGGMSEEAAGNYLANLQQQKRYQRDVY